MPDDIARFVTVATLAFVCGCGAGGGRATGEVDIAIAVSPGDHCPSIESAVAAPAQTSVGGKIAVSVTASDPDPGDKLSYSWAPAAQFDSPSASMSNFTCPAIGLQTLSLTVSDDHKPTPCATKATLAVDCIAP